MLLSQTDDSETVQIFFIAHIKQEHSEGMLYLQSLPLIQLQVFWGLNLQTMIMKLSGNA